MRATLLTFIFVFFCALAFHFLENYQGANKYTNLPQFNLDSQILRDPSSTQSHTNSESSHQLLQFLKEEFPNTQWVIHDSRGQVASSIVGGNIPGVGQSSASILEFTQKICEGLGIPAHQLSNTVQTRQSNSYSFLHEVSQEIEGIPVYKSYIQIMTRSSDSANYLIKNRLSKIRSTDMTQNFNIHQARSGLFEKLKDSNPRLISEDGPILFPLKDETSEVAWRFHIESDLPYYTESEILVSAKTEKILHRFEIKTATQ